MNQRSKVEQSEYPNSPRLPTAEAITKMRELLDELCATEPADAAKIGKVWRLLNGLDEPKSFRPGRR
jgi:hypothetical protein